ncbi:hypothetical protein ACWA2C_16730 [Priestia megaterium]
MTINLDWPWILRKVRLVFLVAVFGVLYKYLDPMWAFIWIFYFALNDMMEIVTDIEEMKEERANAWKSISHKRKGF